MSDQEISSNGARRRLLAAMPVTQQRMELAGIPTAVLEGGEGPPVMFLHGPGGYAAHWMRVIPALAETHRVIAPDLPGHGASETFSGELDIPRVLAWLGELIERTSVTPPALVGQLLGGAIAARFAADSSSRLSRLVLIDTFGLSKFDPAPEFGAALSEFLLTPSRSSHHGLWRHCAHDLDRLERQMGKRWQDFEEYNVERARSPGFRARLPVLMQLFGERPLHRAQLESIAVPTTLIWGRHDRATPISVAEAASTRHGWPLHVIENANDDPPVEQPEALVSLLRAVLSDADRSILNASAIGRGSPSAGEHGSQP